MFPRLAEQLAVLNADVARVVHEGEGLAVFSEYAQIREEHQLLRGQVPHLDEAQHLSPRFGHDLHSPGRPA